MTGLLLLWVTLLARKDRWDIDVSVARKAENANVTLSLSIYARKASAPERSVENPWRNPFSSVFGFCKNNGKPNWRTLHSGWGARCSNFKPISDIYYRKNRDKLEISICYKIPSEILAFPNGAAYKLNFHAHV